ncbi:MAG: Holliday junction resolvase RuvX [Acidimicrobiales bacterium]|nr:Holliday junction resolvase RuvX [Acidimicrobiales bacterium]
MRVLGIDLGAKRIGVAVSDPTGTIASPLEVVARSGDVKRDHRRLLELAAEVGAELLVVGVPLSLDGTIGPAAQGVLEEVAALREAAAATSVSVETYDERLTTVSAERALRDQKVRGAARRKVVDMVAAAVMLQAWLDGRATRLGVDIADPVPEATNDQTQTKP